ncbi:MAG: glycosyltransferase family 4 protein [Rhodoferax sp.]|nr:glycosyltransferase family 4 protein [Chromatiaceae bacterium]MBP8183167.1 glycosyltransferase family 4 protein [Rhodoferax sp.]
MSILVAHPTRQHSHRLAQALQDAGLLLSYWTLLPDRRALSWLPTSLDRLLPAAVMRHSLQFLPVDKVHTLIGPLLLQKLATRFHSVALSQLGEWMAWAAFDRWVARQLPNLWPKVVVGYEMCCAETFRVAKSLGITCVLDAAAFHHAAQDEILDEDKYGAKTWAGKRLRLRKQIEVELADKIICVSELARRSYIDAGVDGSRIVVNQVGCDVTKFSAPAELSRSGAPKFIYVGIPAYHKGFDFLATSFARLLNLYPGAQLHVAGDHAMAGRLVTGHRVRTHGKLSHDQLSKLFAQMDCLVLPSRLESFGMVVVEALAAGVPVIVSDHAGASEAIREDENGWVVKAGDESVLFERMLACCRDIDRVRSMSAACAQSASNYDWSHYSNRSVDIFAPLLPGAS